MNHKEFNNCYTCNCIEISHSKKIGESDPCQSHFHESYELYYLISGDQTFFIKDRTYRIKSGDFIFINTGEIHRVVDIGSPVRERISLTFGQRFFDYFMNDISNMHLMSPYDTQTTLMHLESPDQEFIQGVLFKMMEECKHERPGYVLYMKVLMMELLIHLSRLLNQNTPSEYRYPSSVHKKISDIVRYINKHYYEDITLTSISHDFSISPYYLSRVFKEVTNFSFTEYLNSIRIRESKHLLKDTQLNITQISKKVGYLTPTRFGKVFKDFIGLPPSRYRKVDEWPS